MNTFILPTKELAETLVCTVPFSDLLGNGEIVISATVDITVYSGEDPAPNSMITDGIITTDPTNTMVIFALSGGVAGATYITEVRAVGSSNSIPVKTGFLTVVPANPF